MKVIERSRKGESAISIARSMSVGKTQIQNIIRDQDSIVKRWESGENSESKHGKRQKTAYTDLNDKLLDWFIKLRERNAPVSGPLLKEKALLLSMELGCDDVMASNGWLHKWLKRNNIKAACLSGDRAEVPQDACDDWIMHIPSLCEGYKQEDIYNADESGLYFRALPSKSLVCKGEDCGGIKTSKDRVTILLAASASGDKLKPLIIGRSANPRCFRGHDIKQLGVHYFSNNKAWMTSKLFTEWANMINNKMIIQGRKILIFIDRCSAHTHHWNFPM